MIYFKHKSPQRQPLMLVDTMALRHYNPAWKGGKWRLPFGLFYTQEVGLTSIIACFEIGKCPGKEADYSALGES